MRQGARLAGVESRGEDPKKDAVGSALDAQIGGDHYKTAIQPVEFIHANGMPFIEGCVVKYMVRWRDKGGIETLRKARHYIEILIELELARDAKTP